MMAGSAKPTDTVVVALPVTSAGEGVNLGSRQSLDPC